MEKLLQSAVKLFNMNNERKMNELKGFHEWHKYLIENVPSDLAKKIGNIAVGQTRKAIPIRSFEGQYETVLKDVNCIIEINLKSYNEWAIKINSDDKPKLYKLDKIKKDFTTKLVNVMTDLDFDDVEKEEVSNLISMIDEVNNSN
jgi:hypothetical protein